MATNDHGNCPNCGTDLNGGSIWETFYQRFQTEGYWKDEKGNYTDDPRILDPEEAQKAADEVSESYGATKTHGKWGRAIGIYDMYKDRTARWKCPDCGHEWDRA